MGSAITAWLMKEGVGIILGALGKLLLDYVNERRADAAFKEAGRLETANEVNRQTVEIQDAVESVPRPSDDAVAERLRNGTF